MRRLIYIPIIHSDSDIGSLALALEQRTTALCGEERWARHKSSASQFWQRVSDYLQTLDAKHLKIYQDGFVSDGDLGKQIIEEGARKGSKNYEIILNLLNRGAEVISTEDISLLREEYRHISQVIKTETTSRRSLDSKEYALRKSKLTKERDGFIAKTINETLKDGEVGLLFIGAYHDVIPHLAKDIAVEPLKERGKVKAYFEELIYGTDERNLERLTRYLSSAVSAGVLKQAQNIN